MERLLLLGPVLPSGIENAMAADLERRRLMWRDGIHRTWEPWAPAPLRARVCRAPSKNANVVKVSHLTLVRVISLLKKAPVLRMSQNTSGYPLPLPAHGLPPGLQENTGYPPACCLYLVPVQQPPVYHSDMTLLSSEPRCSKGSQGDLDTSYVSFALGLRCTQQGQSELTLQ